MSGYPIYSPGDELPMEEILEREFGAMSPEDQAIIVASAEAHGHTVREHLCWILGQVMRNPESRAIISDELRHSAEPFGQDPGKEIKQ